MSKAPEEKSGEGIPEGALLSEELDVEPEDYSDFELPEDGDPGDGDDLSWLDEEETDNE